MPATATKAPPRKLGKVSAGTAAEPTPKLAQRIAVLVEKDIIRHGWKVGELLGSELELAKRFGVSRWVMREAINIAERDGLVQIKRGRYGGIAIGAPALDAVGAAIRSYLGVSRASARHLREARVMMEGLAIALAAQRLDDAAIARLRKISQESLKATEANSIEFNYRLLDEILLASGNVAVRMFTVVLAQIVADLATRRGMQEAEIRRVALHSVEFRRKQIEAMIAANDAQAQALVREHHLLSGKLMEHSPRGKANPELMRLPRKLLAPEGGKRPRRAEAVTEKIQAELIANDWPLGHTLGSEAELMARYNVSRSVLREAVRPLERLGVVEMRRGKNSGLKVTQPDPRAVIRSAVLFLNHSKIERRAIQSVLRALELEAVCGGALRPKAERLAAAEALLAVATGMEHPTLESLERSMVAFYDALAALSPSPVVHLFMRILGSTSSLNWKPGVAAADIERTGKNLCAKTTLICEAVSAGDETLARRRMIEMRKMEVAFGTRLKPAELIID